MDRTYPKSELESHIHDLIWNIYQKYIFLSKENEDPSIFFSPVLAKMYDELYDKLLSYRGSDDISEIDIAFFINDLPKYVNGWHGIIVNRIGRKIAFLPEEEYERKKSALIRIEDQYKIPRYEIVGRNDIIIHVVKSPKEQIQILVYYILLSKAEDYTYYFRIGKAYNFPIGFQIGTGKLFPFQELPSSVSESWKFWKAVSNDGKVEEINIGDTMEKGFVIPNDLKPVEGKEYEDQWFLKINVSSVGAMNAESKAIRIVNRNINIIKLFCNVRSKVDRWTTQVDSDFDYFQGKPTELSPNEQLNISSEKLGIVNFANTHGKNIEFSRIPEYDMYIGTINEIIMRHDKEHTDLEKSMLNAIDVYGMIDDSTPLHIKFLLCIIALESLLIGSNQDAIGYKLAERITLLVGDTKPWLEYYSSEHEPEFDDYDSGFLVDAKLHLNKIVTKFYSKRSGFAHQGLTKEKIVTSYNDYMLAVKILKHVFLQLLGLYNNGKGIIYRDPKNDDPEKSLDEYLRARKYGRT